MVTLFSFSIWFYIILNSILIIIVDYNGDLIVSEYLGKGMRYKNNQISFL